MKLFQQVYCICTKRRNKLNQCILNQIEFFDKRVDNIYHRFASTFYEQLFASIKVDAHEVFLEISDAYNIFYQNGQKLTGEIGIKFIKWLGMYHTIQFLSSEQQNIEDYKMEEDLFYIFDFISRQKQLYYELKSIKEIDPSMFEVIFARRMIENVFKEKDMKKGQLAFCNQFLYHSYDEFFTTITRYINIIASTG